MSHLSFSRRFIRTLMLLLTCLSTPILTHAQLPPNHPLQAWESWVEARHPSWACPTRGQEPVCSWPGSLSLQISKTGAHFEVQVTTFNEDTVPLPGSQALPPQNIQVIHEDGGTAPVLFTYLGNQPALTLGAGQFRIQGDLKWHQAPAEVPLPAVYGLLSVTSDMTGKPERRGDLLVLESQEVTSTTQSLQVSIARRIRDGSPLLLDSRIIVRVSGQPRSLKLGQVLPASAQPISINSELPYQFTPSGELSLQLAPGEHSIEISAVVGQPFLELGAAQNDSPLWPTYEQWSWIPDPIFRTVELANAQPVSAVATELPPEWQQGAAYIVDPKQSVSFRELRRGEQEPGQNQLTLERTLWLDLEGAGFTAVDTFSGTMNRDFRLNAQPELALGQATEMAQPVLISNDPVTGARGIELRSQNVSVRGVSRLPEAHSISASGWSSVVDRLSVYLNVPPGWRLLYVSGTPEVPGTWVSSWTLLDVFLVMLLTVATGRLLGRSAAVVVTLALLLNHGEFLEPRISLIHVLLGFVFVSLTKDAGGLWSRFSRGYLYLSAGLWALGALTFAKLQFSEFLFPQLQSGTRFRTVIQTFLAGTETSLLSWPLMCGFVLAAAWALSFLRGANSSMGFLGRAGIAVVGFFVAMMLLSSGIGSILMFSGGSGYNRVASTNYEYQVGRKQKSSSRATEYNDAEFDKAGGASDAFDGTNSFVGTMAERLAAPSAPPIGKIAQSNQQNSPPPAGLNIQSGPAAPIWSWKGFQFQVPGPVHPDHRINFYLLSPSLSRLCSALRLALIALLGWIFWRALGLSIPRLGTVAAILIALGSLHLQAPSASADLPSEPLLSELEKRLDETRCHEPICTSILGLSIELAGNQGTLKLTVQSKGKGAVLIPGPLEQFNVQQVLLDGTTTELMRRTENGFLLVAVPDGLHVLTAVGGVRSDRVATLELPDHPVATTFASSTWQVSGLLPSGAASETLQLTPVTLAKEQLPTSTAVVLPNWFQVERSLEREESLRSHSRITRLGDLSRAATARVELLTGERVLSGAVSVEGTVALVRFAPFEQEQSFDSILAESDQLILVAAKTPRLSEEWRLHCSALWRCTPSGLIPTQQVVDGRFQYRWIPFPGESVSVAAKRLEPSAGEHLTLDSVAYQTRWGSQMIDGSVVISLRATEQSTFTIQAPPGALIRRTSLAGDANQGVIHDTTASFLINPGPQTLEFEYTSPWQPQTIEAMPAVTLSAPANNIALKVVPSPDRWILWTGGPRWGPAVLFWSKIVLVMLGTILLAHYGLLPFGRAEAALLGLGLATLPLVRIGLPLAWLGLIGFLRHHPSLRIFKSLTIERTVLVGITVLGLLVLYGAVEQGLLLAPPMLIVGNSSSAHALNWFVDHTSSGLPQPWVLSLPLWCWRATMLTWSVWLAVAVIRWLKLTVGVARR